MGCALLSPSSNTHIAVTAFLLAGMTAGAVGAYSVSMSAIYWYLYPALVPFVARLFYAGGTVCTIMGLMAALYLALMTAIGHNANSKTNRLLHLGFENEDLVRKLNNANHEIRTPLTAITGFADLLKSEMDSKTIKEFAAAIHRNSIYLKKLVENVLRMSDAEDEAPEVNKEWVPLRAEVTSAVRMLEKKLAEKNLNLDLHFDESCPDKIFVDPLKFQQILVNLLSNSIKFTNKGEIKVAVRALNSHRLAITVADTGIGIGEAAQEQIFEPFFRENRPEVKTVEGSGLGLSLSRNLAKKLGGDLRLKESQPQAGSVFELEIEMTPTENKGRLHGKRIVLVEDNEDIRRVYKKKLEDEGAIVETCENGRIAVDVLAKKDAYYDLILMDLNMPVMDGYSATRLIRQSGFSKPIAALTAYQVNMGNADDFNEVISKTVDIQQFLQTIEHLLTA